MIIQEELIKNERHFVRTYSDEGRYVVRDGVSYEEAIDPTEFGREYTEGDFIKRTDDNMSDDEELTDEQIATILTGGSL